MARILGMLARLRQLLAQERAALVEGLRLLARLDYAEAGQPSLFAYCVRVLGLPEDAARPRVEAARAGARFPRVFSELCFGRAHLGSLAALAAKLTPENHATLLDELRGLSETEARFLAASLDPAPGAPESLVPISGERARLSCDVSREVLEKLGRARELLEEGGTGEVLDRVLEVFLKEKDPDHAPPARRTEPRGEEPVRYVPLWVRRAVWARDRGRCVFETPEKALCGSRAGLEFDHVMPWALGGPSNHPDNIRLLCRTHNQLMARRAFGKNR